MNHTAYELGRLSAQAQSHEQNTAVKQTLKILVAQAQTREEREDILDNFWLAHYATRIGPEWENAATAAYEARRFQRDQEEQDHLIKRHQ